MFSVIFDIARGEINSFVERLAQRVQSQFGGVELLEPSINSVVLAGSIVHSFSINDAITGEKHVLLSETRYEINTKTLNLYTQSCREWESSVFSLVAHQQNLLGYISDTEWRRSQ